MSYHDIKEHSQIAEKVWGESYDVLWPQINKKKLKVGVEIGVAFGGHAERILSKTKARLYCVDPYTHISGYDDPINVSNSQFNRIYKFTKARLSVYSNRVRFLRMSSLQASYKISEKLDFIYIDGDHSLEGVKLDITIWFVKLRVGGIIAGHDYGHSNFPGVKKTVDQFFSRFGWKINIHPSGVWWVEKLDIGISYIVPAYNAENTISESVKSIYKYNFHDNDELIIVDDKSTDNTLKIIKSLARADCRVKVISHSLQKGGGAARNTAVEHAKNQLIFCLDSDNILAPRSIDKLKNLLLSTNSDVATFQKLKYFKTNTSNINHEWVFENDIYDMRNYLSSNIVPGASGNYLFTKNSWHKAGRYPEDQGALDTWGFGLRQVMTGSIMGVLYNSHYFHRIGHESYWIRESKKTNVSLLATQLIIPFIDLLNPRDQDYIFSRKYRKIWFDRLNARSVHINENKTSKIRKVIEYLNKII